MAYQTEAEVIVILSGLLQTAGSNARVSVHSDSQGSNTIERLVIFKAPIGLDGSEAIVNAMCDIGTSTDRGISYRGSQVEAMDGGEVRYLLFDAKINPFEEEY